MTNLSLIVIQVYTIKVGHNDPVDRLEARFIAKGYTLISGVSYYDIFSPITKIASTCLLLSMAAMHSYPICQFNWMSRTFIVILQKSYIWSNHQVILLKGILGWCEGYVFPYIV